LRDPITAPRIRLRGNAWGTSSQASARRRQPAPIRVGATALPSPRPSGRAWRSPCSSHLRGCNARRRRLPADAAPTLAIPSARLTTIAQRTWHQPIKRSSLELPPLPVNEGLSILLYTRMTRIEVPRRLGCLADREFDSTCTSATPRHRSTPRAGPDPRGDRPTSRPCSPPSR
jgi:hypothetical protein